MDQQLQELIYQLRELVPALRGLGGTAGTTTNVSPGAGLEKQFDRLVQALAKINASLGDTARTEGARRRVVDDFVKSVDKAADSQEDLRRATQKAAEAADEAAREERRRSEEQSKTQKEINQQAYQELLKRERMEQNYAALIAREQLQQEKASKTLRRGLEDFAGDSVAAQRRVVMFMEVLDQLGNLGKSMAQFAGELAKGNTKFTSLNPLIDTVTSSLGKMAEVIPYFGNLVSGSMKLAAEGTKFMLDQIQNSLDTFQELSTVGALTAEGMRGIQQQFLESGLSLEGYKRVVRENATTLARFGGSVGDGTKRFTKFLGTIVDSEAGDELRRLGFSADAIGETAAAFMAQQTRLGLSQRKTNEELAKGAKQYALELDQLSKLTGMARKDIQAQQDAAKSESRFRARLDELTEQGKEKEAKALLDFQTMVNQVAPDMAQGLRDLATNNATTEAAQQVLRMGGERILQQVESGVIGPVEAFKQMQQATRDQLPLMRQLSLAVGDETKAFTNYAKASDFVRAQINDAGQVILDQNRQMAKGTEPLTDSTVDAQKSMQQMSRQISNFGFAVMPAASTAVQGFTGALNSFVKAVSKATGIELPNITDTGGAGAGGAAGVGGAGAGGAAGVGGAGAGGAGGAKRFAGGVMGSIEDFVTQGRGFGFYGAGPGPAQLRLEDYIDFTGGTGSKAHFDRLEPGVREAFINMAREYNQLNPGKKLQINSAFRSPEEQAAVDPGTNPKAAPGMSLHNVGRAIDIQGAQVRELRGLGLLDRFGFKTLANDPPHIYMRDGGIVPAKQGGTQIVAGEAGKNEAVVPLPDGKSIPVALQQADQSNKVIQIMDGLLREISDISSINLGNWQEIGPTIGGFNAWQGFNAGPMTTDLSAIKDIAERMGAFDRAANTITDPKTWQTILQSGIATNFEVAGMKLGSAMLPEIRGLMADEIEKLTGGGATVEQAVSQVREEFGRFMSEFIEMQQRSGDLRPLLQELVGLQRNQNSTSEKMLQVAQN